MGRGEGPRWAQQRAGAETFEALDSTVVHLVGIQAAEDVTELVDRRRYLHAGPPLDLDQVPGPMFGALVGALIFEGEARDVEDAREMVNGGDIEIVPCHDAGGVGAMAGVVTPKMPVVVVETNTGQLAFSPLNEGLGQALRFGSFDDRTLGRLAWLRDGFAPLLDRSIRDSDAIDITELQVEGLRRGDECHNRNVATSAALFLRLAPSIVRCARKRDDAVAAIAFVAGNRHFFLPFSMAAAKAITAVAHGIEQSSIVTTIAANGQRVGIRTSGTKNRWFLDEAPIGTPKLFPGHSLEDVQPMMGDSFVTEVIGLGAFSLAAAPAISAFVGGAQDEALQMVHKMGKLCHARSMRFNLPIDGFDGSPVGIDVARVAETSITPVVNNGLAHREPGKGQVGAGLTQLPVKPFIEAWKALSAVEKTKKIRTMREDGAAHGMV